MAKDAGYITDEEAQVYNKKNNVVYENMGPHLKFPVPNAGSGRFDFERRPWARALLRAMSSPAAISALKRAVLQQSGLAVAERGVESAGQAKIRPEVRRPCAGRVSCATLRMISGFEYISLTHC